MNYEYLPNFADQLHNCFMGNKGSKWLLFLLLSVIWGSSFILMKKGMEGLTALQVASVRILASGVVLLPLSLKSFKTIPTSKIPVVTLSGALGSLLPAYLFCVAETGIDSSLAGALNALTPIFTILTGALFFSMHTSSQKVIGVMIAFTGCALLFLSHAMFTEENHYGFILFVMLATVSYGVNVNVVQHYLKDIPSLMIVSMAMTICAVPALVVLIGTGYFSAEHFSSNMLMATGYSVVLGAIGTSVANILFYVLIKKAGSFFASMVTYGIPFVAFFWGVIYGEKIVLMQVFGLFVILGGVYIANKKPQIS